MAIVNGVIMNNMRGTINKELVLKKYGDKTVVSKYPNMSNVVRTEKQIANNLMMKAANNVTKKIMDDEKLRNEAQLRLNVATNKLYNALIREFFKNNKEYFAVKVDANNSLKKTKKKTPVKR
jgi:hypothetical protein